MRFRIRITEAAKQEMRRLPGHLRQRIRRIVESLAENPVPPAAKELRGRPRHYRIALLDWRIIYRVDRDILIVIVPTVRQKTGPETYHDLDEIET